MAALFDLQFIDFFSNIIANNRYNNIAINLNHPEQFDLAYFHLPFHPGFNFPLRFPLNFRFLQYLHQIHEFRTPANYHFGHHSENPQS